MHRFRFCVYAACHLLIADDMAKKKKRRKEKMRIEKKEYKKPLCFQSKQKLWKSLI